MTPCRHIPTLMNDEKKPWPEIQSQCLVRSTSLCRFPKTANQVFTKEEKFEKEKNKEKK